MIRNQRIHHRRYRNPREQERGDEGGAVAKVQHAQREGAEDDGAVEPGEEGALVGEEDLGLDAGGEGDAFARGGLEEWLGGHFGWFGWLLRELDRGRWLKVRCAIAMWFVKSRPSINAALSFFVVPAALSSTCRQRSSSRPGLVTVPIGSVNTQTATAISQSNSIHRNRNIRKLYNRSSKEKETQTQEGGGILPMFRTLSHALLLLPGPWERRDRDRAPNAVTNCYTSQTPTYAHTHTYIHIADMSTAAPVTQGEGGKATPPISTTRLKQIATDACTSALEGAEYYEHAKTGQWNNTIINTILKSLISESTTPPATQPAFKFAVNSTIIQHLVPTSSLGKSSAKKEEAGEKGTTEQAGRRGMNSSTGAYWNEATDGMWSFKFEGGRGLDVVISVIWVGL
ncbi:hypothetical protein V491_03141 [Pseudogymnoascus sp. VKM F-3775]|nr:hypothetical protein V491_03141 [Pseudogymnoascus sp. VKM F-3775]